MMITARKYDMKTIILKNMCYKRFGTLGFINFPQNDSNLGWIGSGDSRVSKKLFVCYLTLTETLVTISRSGPRQRHPFCSQKKGEQLHIHKIKGSVGETNMD